MACILRNFVYKLGYLYTELIVDDKYGKLFLQSLKKDQETIMKGEGDSLWLKIIWSKL